MYPTRFFPRSYFAPRYFPRAGDVPPAPAQEGGMRYPLRHVEFFDDDALTALMMEFISD